MLQRILQSPNLKSFGFSELEEATNDFGPDPVFEEAGFGLAYNGWIDECSLERSRPDIGMAIAIKIFNQKGCPDRQELLAEIKYMGHLCHPNVVKLIGYCLEGDHRLLVYEFMQWQLGESTIWRGFPISTTLLESTCENRTWCC